MSVSNAFENNIEHSATTRGSSAGFGGGLRKIADTGVLTVSLLLRRPPVSGVHIWPLLMGLFQNCLTAYLLRTYLSEGRNYIFPSVLASSMWLAASGSGLSAYGCVPSAYLRLRTLPVRTNEKASTGLALVLVVGRLHQT